MNLVHWICPKRYGKYGDAPRCGSCTVQVIRPECKTPVPKCIEYLVAVNKSLMYSHYFAVQGDINPSILELNTAGDLLQANIEQYDDTFLLRNVTEQEEADKIYHKKQALLRTEFYSKCYGNFAGVIYWNERYSPVVAMGRRGMVRVPKFHDYFTYEPTKECTARQKRELAVLQAPTFVKWNTEVTCTCSTCGPAKIEYVLLHPAVKGATQATSCENSAKGNPQNWWAVWAAKVKPAGTNKFNVLRRNDYSTLVPEYLSLRSNYSTLHRMVPNPN
jgi:hypothetical protein